MAPKELKPLKNHICPSQEIMRLFTYCLHPINEENEVQWHWRHESKMDNDMEET
jgi:hypothetical protein